MSDSINRSAILRYVIIGALIGAILGVGTWVVILFLGMQSAVDGLQSAASSPNTFLLDVALAPNRYFIRFMFVGLFFGACAGITVGMRAIKGRQAQVVDNQPSDDNSWPPPTQPAD